MKRIYFVRHGESEGNVNGHFQGAESPLTPRGVMQAKIVAERCKHLPLQVLVASTMVRAQETGDIIVRTTGLPKESSQLFTERIRPTGLVGKRHDDPEVQGRDAAWLRSLTESGRQVEDGENFEMIKERAGEALAYLAARPEEHIGVITHGFFMRMLLAYVTFGPALSGNEFKQFSRTYHMENTGLSVFVYDEKQGTWWVWVWNDHAHLG